MPKDVSLGVLSSNEEVLFTLDRFLSRAGIDVKGFPRFADLEEELLGVPPDAIVVDTDERRNAWTIAAQVRARSPVGIVLLADDPTEEDRQLSLSIGIDYYLSKPINLPMLESMIRNLARRAVPGAAVAAGRGVSDMGGLKETWTLLSDSWQLVAPGHAAVDLSAAEYRVLELLLQKPGQPLERDVINQRLGKRAAGPDDRSLDVLVSRMRAKVEKETGKQLPIRAARGMGYIFVAPARVNSAGGPTNSSEEQ